jgi:tRNA pseudouridine38-40 synthase
VSAQNYRATVEYDGTDYHGFQLQPKRATIQGELERALERVTQQIVRVNGAGRTDAGVHARGQVVSFQSSWRHPLDDLHRALNAVLPVDIAIRDLALADERFHARFSARSRTYVYTVYNNAVRSPLLARFAYHVPSPLDVEAMTEAASALVGCQDVAAFGQPPVGTQTVRCVYQAEWRPVSRAGLIEFEIEANAFLRGMVRRIVGSLLQVGSGIKTRDEFVALLASRDLARCGVRAPACGLCLERVSYQDST